MTLEELKLTLNPSSATPREYRISILDEVGGEQSKEAFSVAPPGLPPRDNILLGVSGMQRDPSISFAVHDDGTDKADGTATGLGFANDTVVSLAEQRKYLYDTIHAPDFTASWELDHITGGMYNSDPVFVERIDVPAIQQDSPRWLNATIDLRFGSSSP